MIRRRIISWFLVIILIIVSILNLDVKVAQAAGNANAVVSIAFSQIGYHEKNNANDLDDPAIGGSGNYTKYHRDLGANQGDAWCGIFVRWVLQTAGVSSTAWPSGYGYASVPAWQTYYKAKGKYHEKGSYKPKPGDLVIIATSEGHRGHIGIIESADDTAFNYISGNRSDKVCKEWLSQNDNTVTGYCEMDYDSNSNTNPVYDSNPGSPYPILISRYCARV